MSIDALITAGKVLGLPGVVILCWYLLARREADRQRTRDAQEADRQRANDKRAAALERMKIDAENRRTAALEVGFRAIGDQLNNQTERLANIEGVLQIKRRQTPGTGTVVREYNRAKSSGDR